MAIQLKVVKRNKELFNQIADKIEREPENYCQSLWGDKTQQSCGTAHCIGGWAAALSGYKTVDGLFWSEVKKNKRKYEIVSLVTNLLGLSQVEAAKLFSYHWKPKSSFNDLGYDKHDVPNALRRIANGHTI